MDEFEFYKDLQEEVAVEEPPAPKCGGREPEKPERVKKNPRRRSFVLLGVLLAAVLGVVILAAYRDGTGFDVLRRQLTYTGLKANEDGSRGSFLYASDRTNRFAPLGDSLLTASATSIRILRGDGSETYSRSVHLNSPVVSGNGESAVVYDAGGTTLYWLSEQGELAELSCKGVLAATLNDGGYLALTDQASGYKGAVSVYNAKQELVFTFSSSSRFVTDACVTPDNKSVAVVSVGQKDGAFLSNLLFYHLTDQEAYAELALPDAFVERLETAGGRLCAVADTGLTMIGNDGTAEGSYDYSELYLKDAALGGDGFATLLLSRYKSGSLGAVLSVDRNGELIAAQELDEEVLALSAAGEYVAVLYADRLQIYTKKLEPYAEFPSDSLRSVFLRKDGSVLLLSPSSASVYLP